MMRHLSDTLASHPDRACPSPWRPVWAAALVLALTACANQASRLPPATGPVALSGTEAPDTGASAAPGRAPATRQSAGPAEAAEAAAPAPRGTLVGRDIATRHALFRVSAFDALPGWRQDDLGEAWGAFTASCKVLARKPSWQPLCEQVRTLKDPQASRRFLEQSFDLLTVQNTDRTREGDITGYYEPLLQGSTERDARFTVPVYGVPRDLYFLDWKQVPRKQRKGLTHVRVSGRDLLPASADEPGAIAVDLRRFTLDTLDRRLRVRLEGRHGLPYYARADINRAAALDAPVLAWVDDPMALYAMQVQGAGRIRLADGRILRLAYGEQNGQPFKPLRLAASGHERVQTRGARTGADDAADGDIEHFDLAGPDTLADLDDEPAADQASGDGSPALAEPLTRGGHHPRQRPEDPAVDVAVNALLPGGEAAKGHPEAAVPDRPARSGGTRQTGAQALVDDLLQQAQAGSPPPGRHERVAQPRPLKVSRASGRMAQADTMTATLVRQRAQALDSDPSYVFFRAVSAQDMDVGPVGALGVPLTAGRSLAVDPRVVPLGYPVFLDAAIEGKRRAQMQRLMFAQDTGGAIRGAVRADYFWGFGADAGRQARRTRQKGRLWVLVPHAELAALMSGRLLTRGGGALAGPVPDCLVPDRTFCDTDSDTGGDTDDDQAAP